MPLDTKRHVVIGLGTCGLHTLDRNVKKGRFNDRRLYGLDTGTEALGRSKLSNKLQLGPSLVKGAGTWGKLDLAEQAAQESAREIARILDGVDLAIIVAGMGRGTGTGVSPVIAQRAREAGVLTACIAIVPPAFEGPMRVKVARIGIERLRKSVDLLFIFPMEPMIKALPQPSAPVDYLHRMDLFAFQTINALAVAEGDVARMAEEVTRKVYFPLAHAEVTDDTAIVLEYRPPTR